MSVLELKERVCRLPSLGRTYDLSRIPLVDGDSMVLQPMTAGTQGTISSTGGDIFKFYQNIFNLCVVQPKEYEVQDLLMSDVNALLFAVRIVSISDSYTVDFQCGQCGAMQIREFSLSENLQIKYADEFEPPKDPNGKGFQSTELELELDGGGKLTYHLPCMRDEKQFWGYYKAMLESKQIDGSPVTMNLARMAQYMDTYTSPEGKTETPIIQKKMEIVKNLSLTDVATWSDDLEYYDVGIVPAQKSSCSVCTAVNEVEVAMGPGFFRAKPRPRRQSTDIANTIGVSR